MSYVKQIASGTFRPVAYNFISIYIHVQKRYRNMCNRMCGHKYGVNIQSFFSFMNTIPIAKHECKLSGKRIENNVKSYL